MSDRIPCRWAHLSGKATAAALFPPPAAPPYSTSSQSMFQKSSCGLFQSYVGRPSTGGFGRQWEAMSSGCGTCSSSSRARSLASLSPAIALHEVFVDPSENFSRKNPLDIGIHVLFDYVQHFLLRLLDLDVDLLTPLLGHCAFENKPQCAPLSPLDNSSVTVGNVLGSFDDTVDSFS